MARAPGGGRSGAEPLASARAPRGNHLASAFGRHAGAEAVAPLAHQIARLEGPLHGSFSAGIARPRGVGPGPRIYPGFGGIRRVQKLAGLYGRPPVFVNATAAMAAQARERASQGGESAVSRLAVG